MKKVNLTKGYKALVDDEDYEVVNSYSWHVLRNGYAIARVKGTTKKILMHRLIMNAPSDKKIDHINQDKLDNRKENLRFATVAENARNSKFRGRNTSGYKGVSFKVSKNRWLATIVVNGKHKQVGSFMGKKDAAIAYNIAAVKYFGEFAYLNTV